MWALVISCFPLDRRLTTKEAASPQGSKIWNWSPSWWVKSIGIVKHCIFLLFWKWCFIMHIGMIRSKIGLKIVVKQNNSFEISELTPCNKVILLKINKQKCFIWSVLFIIIRQSVKPKCKWEDDQTTAYSEVNLYLSPLNWPLSNLPLSPLSTQYLLHSSFLSLPMNGCRKTEEFCMGWVLDEIISVSIRAWNNSHWIKISPHLLPRFVKHCTSVPFVLKAAPGNHSFAIYCTLFGWACALLGYLNYEGVIQGSRGWSPQPRSSWSTIVGRQYHSRKFNLKTDSCIQTIYYIQFQGGQSTAWGCFQSAPRGGGGGGALALRTSQKKGSFLRTSHVRDFVKEVYFFVPRYEVWGWKSPYNPRKICGSDAEWLLKWLGFWVCCRHLLPLDRQRIIKI